MLPPKKCNSVLIREGVIQEVLYLDFIISTQCIKDNKTKPISHSVNHKRPKTFIISAITISINLTFKINLKTFMVIFH